LANCHKSRITLSINTKSKYNKIAIQSNNNQLQSNNNQIQSNNYNKNLLSYLIELTN